MVILSVAEYSQFGELSKGGPWEKTKTEQKSRHLGKHGGWRRLEKIGSSESVPNYSTLA